jgi:hypothetical protein
MRRRCQVATPEAFHRFAAHFVGEATSSAMFDTDPGIAVRNKPIYRLRWAVACEWTGHSFSTHPDFALVPEAQDAWGSASPARASRVRPR